MAINHGLHCKLPNRGERLKAEEQMKFRYGIHAVFDALKMGPFLLGRPEHRDAAKLEYHFTEVCQRFVFSLQHLAGLLPQLLNARGVKSFSPVSLHLQFQSECAADHVLSYLNTLVDDIALMILLATGYPISRDADSMGKFRKDALRNAPALAAVRPLLLELDDRDSWFRIAFWQESGARQLIVHNQHLVKFQVSESANDRYLWSLLQCAFSEKTTPCSDFLGLIRATLKSLFDWLDRLELSLTTHLRALDRAWEPPEHCHYFSVPVGYPPGTTTFEEEYFPIPLCDGSDPLPWTSTLTLNKGQG